LEIQAPVRTRADETRIVQKHPTPSAEASNPPTYHRADLPPPLQRALDAALDKSARAPVILNVTDITGYTDWVLIVSGRSDRHVQAIADGIADELETTGVRPYASEGGDHTWDLLDYDDFMVHVFYHPVRMHFDLESMWSDAPRVTLDLPDEVMDTTELDTLSAPNSLPAYRGDMIFGGFEDEFAD
jgi:ribosome-associated protein